MYNVLLVAKYIINHCNNINVPVSNLKLQKLLYFVQADFLVNTDSPCFPEEIEAWEFGPVIPVVYQRYKIYGSSPIPRTISSMVGRIELSDRIRIMRMVDRCAKYSASRLVELTHRQDPWINAYSPRRRNIIPKRSIKEFFME